ncbi:MAG: condensation domain-containing protein [Pseudomonadota bacterium]
MNSGSNLNLIRPLGTSERFYWIYDQIICRNFSIIVEIDMHIPMKLIRSAISKVISNHPLLRAKIVTGPGNHLDFAMVTVEEAINSIIINQSSSSVNDQVLKEINTQFQPESFPLMRTCIVKTSEEKASIVFTFHHSVTDAIGGIFFVRKILEYVLRGSAANPDTLIDSNTTISAAQESLFPSKYQGWRLLFRLANGLAYRVIETSRKKETNELSPIGKLNLQRKLGIIRLVFDESKTESIVKRCHDKEVTVNAALCSSFLLSIIEEFDTVDKNGLNDVGVPLVSAINMRRFLKNPTNPKNIPGMFASILESTHIYDSSTNLWELARDINKGITDNLALGRAHTFLKILSLLKRALTPDENGKKRVLRLMSSGTYGPFVTNLGVVDPPRTTFEKPVMSLSFATAPVANFPLLLAENSWAGRLFINMTIDINVIDQKRAQRIADNMMQKLMKMTQN